jgi:hypothetical protein
MKIIEQKSKQIQCNCGTTFEYDDIDIKTGAYGFPYVVCPKCEQQIEIADEPYKKISKENINFPDDFYYFGDGFHVEDNQINEWIKSRIHNLEMRSEDYGVSSSLSCGDTHVAVFKFEDEYEIVVSRGYYRYSLTRGEE